MQQVEKVGAQAMAHLCNIYKFRTDCWHAATLRDISAELLENEIVHAIHMHSTSRLAVVP